VTANCCVTRPGLVRGNISYLRHHAPSFAFLVKRRSLLRPIASDYPLRYRHAASPNRVDMTRPIG
jgi:hypothetical protein